MEIYGKAIASIESTDDDKFGPNGGFTAVLSTPSEDRDGDRLHREEWKDFTQERYPLDMDHGMSVADTVGSFVPYWDGDRMMMDAAFAKTAKAQDVRALVTPDENGIRHISAVSVAFMTDKTKKSGEPQRELLNAGIVAIPSNRDAVILASKAAGALRDAFSDATEGDVPDEVKAAVLETLGAKLTDDAGTEADKGEGVFIDVHAQLDPASVKAVQDQIDELVASINDRITKAAATASGVGGDGALVQAIHDASSHLGAGCPVIEVEVTDEGTGASDGANKSFVIGKAVVGTLEDLQDRLCRALSSEFPNDYPYPRATFLDEDGQSGTVVYRLGDDLWAASFTDDGADVEVDTDNARPVGLITTMVDDPDGKSADKREAFEKALDEVLTPEESPAEAAAASVEEPAPADDAADEKATRARALQMLQMRAQLIKS